MACAKLVALFHLSLLLVTSVSAFNEALIFAQPPHNTHPSHPPVAAPSPGHHHKGGHHHHHPKPPTKAPIPPIKAPTPPPMKPPTPPPKAHAPPPKAHAPPPKAHTPPPKAPTPPPKAHAPPPKYHAPPPKAHAPPPKAHTPPPKAPTPPPKYPTPPTKAPTPPPKYPTPPTKAPTPPPKYPPIPPVVKKPVAIQGVVYCKSCRYTGVNTLIGAKALANATVKIVCESGKYHMVQKATTDKNGFFYMVPAKLYTNGIGICKVVLAKSPSAKCSVPTNLHSGLKGALLVPPPKPNTPSVSSKYALFTVGPFAYEPAKKC